MAVPFNLTAMMGNAILRDVASSAAARVTTHIDANAKTNPRVGWKAGFASSSGGRGVSAASWGVFDVGEVLSPAFSISEREPSLALSEAAILRGTFKVSKQQWILTDMTELKMVCNKNQTIEC